MKRLVSILCMGIVISLFFLTACAPQPQETSWGWKRSTEPDDVMNFLNSEAPYTQPIKKAKITAVNKGSYIDFIVFYQTGESGDASGGWGWKKSTDPDDVMNFLSGTGDYERPVKSAEVVAVNMPTYTEFYVFYTR